MAALMHAYFLHTRAYRETSLLVECFTAEAGRLSGVWRGGRRNKSGVPQLFQPLLVEVAGQGELHNLNKVESAGPALMLAGAALFSGFYLNELLIRLLPREEVQPGLFVTYAEVLGRLAEGEAAEPLLRAFEMSLLDGLGYGIDYGNDSEQGEPVSAALAYDFYPERGFTRTSAVTGAFAGAVLLKLAQGNFGDPDAAQAAKRIHRMALARLLGSKPLKSRELFIAAQDLK
ncbi:MAG: repair protein RecO [Moraxellaceae bacterium]|jgi:DNA repair protein RecO (recombination protein O)|nr:repair protein RecO [Moraxellaceae bacterium]